MELLTLYYAKRLRALGYPADNVQYNLSWSQGDGVAFYGKLTAEGLMRVAQRVVLGAGRVKAFLTLQPMILEAALSAEIERVGSHRDHDASTMRPQLVVNADRGEDIHPELDEAIESLEPAIAEEARLLSQEFAQIGYDVIEACVSTPETLLEGPVDAGYERLTLEPADMDPDVDAAADEDVSSLERFIRSMTGSRVGEAVLRRYRSATARRPTAEASEFVVLRGQAPRTIARLRSKLAAQLDAQAHRAHAA